MSDPKVGFEMRKIHLSLDVILPVRHIKDPDKRYRRYRAVRESIREVGLVEPLVVHPQKGSPGKYLLLDGNLRYLALKELGRNEADCIVATDDESYTYNARISRMSPIQEHKMIVKAVRNGVEPERIASALNIPLKDVHALMNLLNGIHEEAADLLKDKGMSPIAIRLLKKVNGVRQIEIAELMVNLNNYTSGYAEALVIATPKDQLANPNEPKQKAGISAADIKKMEDEMESLQCEFKVADEAYGEKMLNLTVARGYIKKLVENPKVVRFLGANHADILSEFQSMAAADAL